MEQSSLLTRALSDAQENSLVTFRLYTEFRPNLPELVNRYFSGATLFDTQGLWQGQEEQGTVIDIVGTLQDLQTIVHLAGDIKQVNEQSSVLVTWHRTNVLNV